MNFKEQLDKDLENSFFNKNEFSESCLIDGIKVEVIIDNDKLKERQTKVAEGTYRGDVLFYVSKKYFEKKPKVGKVMKFNNDIFTISEVIEDIGTYEITLEANRS